MKFDPKTSSHIFTDDSSVVFRDAKKTRKNVLHLVRHLTRLVNSQVILDWVIIREDRAGFECNAGMPIEPKIIFDHYLPCFEFYFNICFAQCPIKSAIVTE